MNQLASSVEPLVLADGTKIDPNTGTVIKDRPVTIEVPSAKEAQRLVMNIRRTIAELPDVPKTMTPINVVMVYEMFGLTDEQIAIAVNITVSQVQNIKNHDAYSKMRNVIIQNMLDSNADEIASIIAAGQKKAATKLTSLVDNQDDKIALDASKAVLSANGMRDGADAMSAMSIMIIRRDNATPMPNITISMGD